jgi:nicotinate phosphoribosyltransferase
VAGAIGVSTDAQASWWGGAGVGTVPARADRRLRRRHRRAARAFAKRYRRRDERHGARRLRERLGPTALDVAGALGRDLWGVRLDTSDSSPTARCSASRRRTPHGRGARAGPAHARRARRRRLTRRQIVVSGGFNAERIRAFETAGVPVDAYGVGSSLIRGSNDFTADVVMVDGRPAGRSAASIGPTTA